jgi:hypothetical protein
MKWLIVLLTAATGVLHLLVGFNVIAGSGMESTAWLLVLNGVGYLVLLALYWTASGSRRSTVRWILLAYTLITLVGYFIIGAGFNGGTIPLLIKAIELLLIILLFLDRGSETVVAPATTTTATRTGSAYSAPPSSTYTTPSSSAADAGARAMTDADATAAAAASAAAAGMGTASAGMSVAPLAMSAAALGAAAAADETVEETVDEAEAAVADEGLERVDYAADTSVAAVYDTAEDAGDVVADTTDWVGDKAGDAVEATGDAVSGAGAAVMGATVAAGDWVDDKADEAGEAMGDVAADVDAGVADWVGESVDEPVDTAHVFAAADDRAGTSADWVGDAYDTSGAIDIDTTDAAALDAQQLAAEPSVDELRSELEEYLRSFGSSSEFRKGVEYIEGIGPVMGEKLRAAGVITVLDLMVNGATRRGRKQLSDRSGIAQSNILTWVNHIDLFRIKGVAEEYADLLEQSGVDTVVELAQRNPNNLFKRMNDINEQRRLVRRMPRQADVQDWVVQAKSLKRLVHY